jgi:hypothetical protein
MMANASLSGTVGIEISSVSPMCLFRIVYRSRVTTWRAMAWARRRGGADRT